MNNKINKISPLHNMLLTIGLLPSSYLVSMTYEEQLLWLCNFLKTEVIPKTNANIEAVNQLITYIDNYFDNLDVQEEINNKLDEMVEEGTLQEIITEYLQINGVLGYDTVADMVSATNIINGSICRTLGLNTYNDGKGEFYKIRTITSGDTVDGVNIIALNISNTLIAEKIPNYDINQINNNLSTLNSDVSLLKNKKVVFIGDSYGTISQNDWATLTANRLGLTLNSSYYKIAHGGYGFIGGEGDEEKYFIHLLNEIAQSVTNPNEITDVVVCGGINDRTYNSTDINSAISTFIARSRELFPNALVSVGMISWTKNSSYQSEMSKIISCYQSAANNAGGAYINGSEFCWHYYNWLSDDVHPNQDGQNAISMCITNYLLTGSGLIKTGRELTGTITGSNSFTVSSSVLKTYQNGNTVNINIGGMFTHSTNVEYTNNNTYLEIGTFNYTYFSGSDECVIPCQVYVIDSSNKVYKRIANIKFKDGKIYFGGQEKSGTSTTALTENIRIIQILPTIATICTVGN